MKIIDINCDLGEGMDTDEFIMPYITSCNISCGAHAGNLQILDNTLDIAKKYGVKVGAHPSYPDRENFGREVLKLKKTALEESILSQLMTFKEAAIKKNLSIHHIKPHGALYNQAAIDPEIAEIILKIMEKHFPDQIIYTPYGSVIASMAHHYNIKVWYEAFADRNYNDDFTLLSRSNPNALKHEIQDILEHIDLIINKEQVKTSTGNILDLKVDTLCIHGDNPNAIAIAKAIYNKQIRI
ncbi:MAG TPA: 5-oxoprolinase subunit PxpA [Anditalea sp.]|nr:5-oxoprolinase subunit PxpA [Anditalea sp.]